MLKKVVVFTTAGLFGVVLFVFALNWFGTEEILRSFDTFTWDAFVLFLLVSFSLFSGHVWRWQMILKCHGHSVPFWKLYRYRLEGYAASYLTPSAFIGGEPLRAFLLKTKEDIPYTKGVSSILIDKNFELSVNGFFVLVGIFLLLLNFTLPKQFEVLILAGVFFSLAISVLIYWQLIKRKNMLHTLFLFLRLHKISFFLSFEKKFIETDQLLHAFFLEHKYVYKKIFLSMILLWALVYAEYYLALQLIGIEPAFTLIFLVFAMVGISFIAPIPGALGVLEATQAAIFSLYGAAPSAGIALSLVIRARDVLWVLLGLLGIGVHGMRQFYLFIIGKKSFEGEKRR